MNGSNTGYIYQAPFSACMERYGTRLTVNLKLPLSQKVHQPFLPSQQIHLRNPSQSSEFLSHYCTGFYYYHPGRRRDSWPRPQTVCLAFPVDEFVKTGHSFLNFLKPSTEYLIHYTTTHTLRSPGLQRRSSAFIKDPKGKSHERARS